MQYVSFFRHWLVGIVWKTRENHPLGKYFAHLAKWMSVITGRGDVQLVMVGDILDMLELESSDQFEATLDEESGEPVELEVINFNEIISGQIRAI